MTRVFRSFHLFLALSMVCIPGREAWSQETFTLDNAHTSIIFSVSHYKIAYIFGRFNLCTGNIEIDSENPAACRFKFAIATHSIDTNDDTRDNVLKSVEFFDVEQFPNIDFESTSVVEDKGMYQVAGKIKLHGQEKEIIIPLQLLGVGEGPLGKTRMGMLGKFRINRSDFGMEKMLDNLGDEIAITFSFEAFKNE